MQYLGLVLAIVANIFVWCVGLVLVLKLIKQLFVDLLHSSCLFVCLFELLTHILDLVFQVLDVLLNLDSFRGLDTFTLVHITIDLVIAKLAVVSVSAIA